MFITLWTIMWPKGGGRKKWKTFYHDSYFEHIKDAKSN